ncbi:Hypothetical protein NCS54_00802100 [Fusarium falciforme]|uniref:Hypothetical protein n=1 Tax=Fusarium falciforme TaxID=195108 RepID=UPI002301A037|nr:Hypothetical protein NCS54_00802100 [Fusarium falciforme]WAO90587.1 Hypothetical protein NCS54_00802100 [Fusarium falciforme]
MLEFHLQVLWYAMFFDIVPDVSFWRFPSPTFTNGILPSGPSVRPSLWADYNVCVGIIGQTPTPTPTNPGNSISTPTPIQAGMISSCKKFHLVKSTTLCGSIQNYYKITMANHYGLNPAIGSGCKSLRAEYYVCVGV